MWLAAAIALTAAAGCGFMGGSTTNNVTYSVGELKSTEQASLSDCWDATLAALQELGLPVTSSRVDSLKGELIARGAEDKKISISLKAVSSSLTQIFIRVELLGDETLSRSILDGIHKHLKKSGG